MSVFPKAQWWRAALIHILVADQATKEYPMNKNLFEIIWKAVALGMGVAVIVLNTISTLSLNTGMSLLGIGITALALSGLEK
jgi:hypothetical protein